MKSRDFDAAVIAQDDDEDYEESGWVAWVIGETAYLGSYSHCSCYGTFEVICDDYANATSEGTPRYDWSGTVAELVAMAERKADPNMPERMSDPKDCDYDHLMKVYEQVIAWHAMQGVAQ